MAAVLEMKKFPSAEIIEIYLQKELGDVATWMTEKKVISTVAAHFSRLRYPEDPRGFKINVALALHDWLKQSGGGIFEGLPELLEGSLKKFPKDKLVTIEGE